MPTIAQFSASSAYGRGAVSLTWQLVDTPEDLTAYTFEVVRTERAETLDLLATTPAGLVLGTVSPGVGLFQDTSVNLLRYPAQHWYWGILSDAAGPVQIVGPESVGGTPVSPVTETIRYNEAIQFALAQRPVIFLRKSRSGQRCPQCWDPVRHTTSLSHCPLCYGVGYYPGYWQWPTRLLITRAAPLINVEIQPGSVSAREQPVAFQAPAWPPLLPDDLFVDQEGDRWRLLETETTQLGGQYLHVEGTMERIAYLDAAYSVPLTPTTSPAWPT